MSAPSSNEDDVSLPADSHPRRRRLLVVGAVAVLAVAGVLAVPMVEKYRDASDRAT